MPHPRKAVFQPAFLGCGEGSVHAFTFPIGVHVQRARCPDDLRSLRSPNACAGDPAQAGPVILAWAVEGLGHWLRDGLGAGGCQGSDRCPTGADRNRWATAAHEDEGLPTASSSKRPPPPHAPAEMLLRIKI